MFKIIKRLLKILALVVGVLIAILGSYLIYISVQFYRIEDNLELDLVNNQTAIVEQDQTYHIMTYNIGFGAYVPDFSFFMDTGHMADGTYVQGTSGTAKDLATVEYSTKGSIDLIAEYNPDFVFWQEVDTDSTRSYHVNQVQAIQTHFNNYGSTFASNFHSAYLAYPLFDNHGKSNAGLLTIAKYQLASSTRRSFPVDMSFFAKFFDLDRCFMVTRLAIANTSKELVLINLHMSAYDEGGKIRAQQLEMLCTILNDEYAKGNYVIAGGDFNHDIAESVGVFPCQQLLPEWVATLKAEQLPTGYLFADANNNAPTCRACDIPYEAGVNYTVVVDGFIISDNIEICEVKNIDNQFLYSDHNPVSLKFKLISE